MDDTNAIIILGSRRQTRQALSKTHKRLKTINSIQYTTFENNKRNSMLSNIASTLRHLFRKQSKRFQHRNGKYTITW